MSIIQQFTFRLCRYIARFVSVSGLRNISLYSTIFYSKCMLWILVSVKPAAHHRHTSVVVRQRLNPRLQFLGYAHEHIEFRSVSKWLSKWISMYKTLVLSREIRLVKGKETKFRREHYSWSIKDLLFDIYVIILK